MIGISLKQIIPFYPLFQMIRVQVKFGIARSRSWSLLAIWLIKIIVLEPLRIIEACVMAILPEKEVRPVFILGYYRSGTTYLQELLSANSTHATLTLFQSVLPEVSLCFGWLFKPILSLLFRLFKVQNEFHNIPFDFDFPGEEDVAINASMAFYDYNRIYQYPSHYEEITRDMLISSDLKTNRIWLAHHRYLLKKIAYISGKKTIILKSPPNMARTPLLLEAYPTASFVFIHRNPFQCIQSTKRIWDLNRSFSFEQYSDEQALNLISKQYQLFYECYSKAKKPVFTSVVRFSVLIAQSQKSIKQIYSDLSLQNFEESENRIESIVKKREKEPSTFGREDNLQIDNFHRIKEISDELGYD